MRAYKISDRYVDLDHVLAVSDLFFWKPNIDDTPYDAWFYITLALRNKRMKIGFPYIEEDNNRESIQRMYNNFLIAWQDK